MSGQPGIDAMDPWASVPEDESAFGDLAAIVLRDDTQDLPFGTGIVTPEHPEGNAPLPATDLNVALGLVDSPIAMIALQGPPPSTGVSVVPLALFVLGLLALIKGTK